MPDERDVSANESLVFGKNAVLELLKSGRAVDVVYLAAGADDRQLSHFVALAKEKGAVVKRVPRNKLDQICGGGRHQDVAAFAARVAYSSVEDIRAAARARGEDLFLLIADGIEDPHNLGAIIRTAEAAGAHGLVIAKRGGVGVTATVQRASAGAVNHLPIARVPNLAAVVRELKKDGVFCYAADMDGADVYKTDLTGPVMLIVGAEGGGVSRLLKELADQSVALPMRGAVASLNASVAAGVLLYEAVRQRMTNKKRGE